MAKAKRGKSGSASDLVRWDSELMKLPYLEDDWKPYIVFIAPNKSTDVPVISLLSEIISSGVRKLFTVVEHDSLLDEVKELALSQGKAVKGKVPPATTRPPQFLEVCEQAKTLMDQDEAITVSLLAKIVKFKMLMVKNKDLDRREVEKKLAVKDSKQRTDSRSGSKASARKSASPGKGKKGAKKEEVAPSPKKDTQLKRRGEEGDDFKTIDDEPDDVTDPQHYIVITGFDDAQLLNHLIDMKIPIDVIINLDTDYHLRLGNFVTKEPSLVASVDPLNSNNTLDTTIDHTHSDYQEKLTKFWKDADTLIKEAPQGHHLHNVAKFDLFVDGDSLPDVSFDVLDVEKKNQFSLWLFNKLAAVCYDLLDYYQQYKGYLSNLKVIDVSAESYLRPTPDASPELVAAAVENEQEAYRAENLISEIDPSSVDMRYYNQLMDYIPMEIDSVPLILDCMLQQVVATTDGTGPMDEEPPKREDGLNHVIGSYLDEKLAYYGLDNKPNFWYNQNVPEVSPHIVYYGNESGFRLCKFDASEDVNPAEIEKKLMLLHPYSRLKTYLQSSPDELVDSTVRHQQLYNFCNSKYPISKEKFERVMRQYIFESLPSENIENACAPVTCEDKDLGKALQKWDEFYFNLLHSGSALAIVRDSEGDLPEKSISLNLDSYCCLEAFSPSVLLQVLEEGCNFRPYVDTYYNHGNNTLLVVLQNPTNNNLENNQEWDSWLHSDVGFRNYLEYVAVEIQDWIREQEMIEEERNRAIVEEPAASVPVVPPPKERSRWGMKTRVEMKQEEEKEETRKKSGGKRSRSRSPKKSASRSPQKKKSEKNARRSNSGKNGSVSTVSKVSMMSEDISLLPDLEKVYAFTGYNLRDDIVHVSGDISYMFPQDGSIIKVERTEYIQKNKYVNISVLKQNGDVFTLHLVNPCKNVLAKDLSDLDNKGVNIDENNNCIDDDNGLNTSHGGSVDIDVNNNDSDNIGNRSGGNSADISSNDIEDSNHNINGNDNVANDSGDTNTNNINNNMTNENNKINSDHIDSADSKNKDNKKTTERGIDSATEGKINSECGESVAHLPSLPCVSGQIAQYSSIRATFADGMVLVCSNSVSVAVEKTEPIESDVSLEHSASAPTESFQGKSAGKKSVKKKDDDTKAQEETDKLQALAMENEEKLQQRLHEIEQMTKEQEAVKNLYVTTTNGLHISFLHHAAIKYSDSLTTTESTFLVKLENFVNKVGKSTANKGLVNELYRCIMEDGYVVQYLSDSTVRVLSPNGDIFHSTPFKLLQHAMVSYNEVVNDQPKAANTSASEQRKGGRSPAMKSPKDMHHVEDVPLPPKGTFESVDWHITYSTGERKIKRSDGSMEDVQSLLVSNARCYETNEILQTREDGVIVVQKPDGSTIVEYMDGTRIITQSDDGSTTSALNLIRIEQESMASVVVNQADVSISVIYGNTRVVKGMKNGGYFVSKNGAIEMVIDGNGNASLYPLHQVGLSNESSVQLPCHKTIEKNTCLLKQSGEDCLYVTDKVGNKFTVNVFGEYNIEKKPQQHPLKSIIQPRYFVIYPNGNGVELLRYEDVAGYIQQAEADLSSAVIRAVLEGESDAEAITIIKPYEGPPSKIWKTEKSMENIIPRGLRERDFKLFPPVEKKTDGPRLGTKIISPCKPAKNEIKCPDILELRHLTRYKELTTEVREQILKVISDYGEFVQQQQQMKDDLHSKELRGEEEVSMAAEVQARYMKLKGDEGNIVDKYLEAITPPPPEPIPHAQPKRSSEEWEKDKRELEELNHAKTVIRNRIFPKYMDTEEGQKFLLSNGMVSPDMEKLTDSLAFETRHPTEDDFLSSTPNGTSHISHIGSTPGATSTPHLDESSMLSVESSSMSMQYNSSSTGHSEMTFNSAEGKLNSSRPFNPTPLRQSEHQDTISESVLESKLEPIDENTLNKSDMKCNGKEMLKSRTHDVCGEVRKQQVRTPPSIRGSRPNAVPNEKFSRVEGPVRRQVKTASIASTLNMKDTTCLRGFVLIPDYVDFGVLKEGLTYSHQVTLKNVGIDTCRFKIKQPPPSTGLKVKYQPGPVAAGMFITFEIEIFAIAVGVDGSSGVGQVTHCIEIVTETDFLYFPVNATIIAQNDERSTDSIPCAGPSKGTLILNDRPSSRESLTRPRKE